MFSISSVRTCTFHRRWFQALFGHCRLLFYVILISSWNQAVYSRIRIEKQREKMSFEEVISFIKQKINKRSSQTSYFLYDWH